MFEKKMTENDKKKEIKMKKTEAKKSGGAREKTLSVVKTLVLPLLFVALVTCVIYVVTQERAKGEELKTTVVCMKENVPANTFVEAKDIDKYFVETKVDMTAVPTTAYKSLSELSKKGFYIEDAMTKSQMVLKDNLADSDAVMDKYKPGYEVTSFNAQEFADGVNGSLRKGDIVDVYAIDPTTELLTLMASNVYVADVYDNSGKKITEDSEIATSFTVYVTPEEVEQINNAVVYGGIQMYLKAE